MSDTKLHSIVKENHENLRAVFKAKGIENRFEDDVTGAKATQRAAFMGLGSGGTQKDLDDPATKLAAQLLENQKNIRTLTEETGAKASKSSVDLAGFMGLDSN